MFVRSALLVAGLNASTVTASVSVDCPAHDVRSNVVVSVFDLLAPLPDFANMHESLLHTHEPDGVPLNRA